MTVFEMIRKYEYFEVGDPDDMRELKTRQDEYLAKGIETDIKYATVEPEHKTLAFLIPNVSQ